MENLTPFARKVLAASGASEELQEEILHPHDLFPVSRAKSMQAFRARLQQAKENNEKVLIAGDYDCDGILSTAIFTKGLDNYGVINSYHIPNRLKEGYGLNPKTVEQAHAQGYSLIITCDNGVHADAALQKARELGVEVIVTDHHLIDGEVDCSILVHPDTLEPEFAYLCGAGIAYECIRALQADNAELLVYAAIASVADCMEVGRQTRCIIQKGLDLFNRNPDPHFAPFVRSFPITERDAGFQIAPRINAIGRLADRATAKYFVNYLKNRDPQKIANYAAKVDALNEERKQLSSQVYGKCELMINPLRPVLLAKDPAFHEGVIGLAAGNLCTHYHKPAIVCTEAAEGFKGSMRAPKGFHCLEFLNEFDGFATLGGHAQAAGFTVKKERWQDFEAFIRDHGREYTWSEEVKLPIDIVPWEVTVANIRSLDALRPFGTGFEMPQFRISEPVLTGYFDMSQGRHRKFSLEGGLQAINFNQSSVDANAAMDQIESFKGTLSISSYRGRESADFLIDEITYKEA